MLQKSLDEIISHTQLQCSPYTATGKYLKQMCDNWRVEYADEDDEQTIRYRLLCKINSFAPVFKPTLGKYEY